MAFSVFTRDDWKLKLPAQHASSLPASGLGEAVTCQDHPASWWWSCSQSSRRKLRAAFVSIRREIFYPLQGEDFHLVPAGVPAWFLGRRLTHGTDSDSVLRKSGKSSKLGLM